MTLSNSKNFHSVESLNQFVLDLLLQIINDNPKASILLSGGNIPKKIYSSFGSLPQRSKLCTFIPSDERRVPVTDPLSNEGMIRKYLNTYNRDQILSLHDLSLSSKLNEISSHDLAILGMGTDGHFASIFPFMSNLDEAIYSSDPVIRVDSGYPEVPRITLSLNEILKSKKIVLLITGQEKVDLLKTKRDNASSLPIDALIEKADNLEILLAE